MTWKMTITSISNTDDTLEVTADTLEDLAWRTQVAQIDSDEPSALYPDPNNPPTPIEEYARLLAKEPSPNPPTPRDDWPPFPPDPTEPRVEFEVEAMKTWILSRPVRRDESASSDEIMNI